MSDQQRSEADKELERAITSYGRTPEAVIIRRCIAERDATIAELRAEVARLDDLADRRCKEIELLQGVDVRRVEQIAALQARSAAATELVLSITGSGVHLRDDHDKRECNWCKLEKILRPTTEK